MVCHLSCHVSGENIGTLFHSSRVEKFHAERNKLKVVSVAVLCSKFYTGRLGTVWNIGIKNTRIEEKNAGIGGVCSGKIEERKNAGTN